jgi:hypothetical protein
MPVVTSKTVLVLAGPFAKLPDPAKVAAAIGRGLEADGRLQSDLLPVDRGPQSIPQARSRLLDEADFDRRMRAARAIVIAQERLDDLTLATGVAFEAATRARQAGVPAYAIAAERALDSFEARIVDLQVILEAHTPRALITAGRKLAELV